MGKRSVFSDSTMNVYGYSSQSPIVRIDPDGNADIGIAAYKQGGEKGTFEGRMKRLKLDRTYTAHTGQELIESLVAESKIEAIDKLVIGSLVLVPQSI